MTLHEYKPHRKYPWFCELCGYPEHERLKHPASGTSASGQDAQRLEGEAPQARPEGDAQGVSEHE